MQLTGQVNTLTYSLISVFQLNKKLIDKESHTKVNQARAKAIEVFQELGVPNSRVEDYKYTNLQPSFSGEYNRVLSNPKDANGLLAEFQCEVPELSTSQVYCVNGWYSQAKALENLPKSVFIGGFKEFAIKFPHLVDQYYNEAAPKDKEGMVALNTAFAQDGFAIYVPKGVVVEEPIQVVNIITSESDLAVNQRNLIIIEDNAQAKVMVCDHTLAPYKFLINSVSEVFVGENSVFDIYNLQSQHNLTTQVAGTYIRQRKHSNVMTNMLTLHAGMARNNIYVSMDDEHCETHLNGLFLADKNQHVDNFTFIDHSKPNCYSNELFKGVMDDFSTGVFTGKIMVRPDAQKTNAFQSNNNLLLTNNAKINTKPQLEIYADDVKCSHGATIGQLDQNAMFYLRSRGLGVEEARILLMYAFTYEVVERIRVEPLKEQIKGLVEKRFRGELDKCESCVVCGNMGTKVSCL